MVKSFGSVRYLALSCSLLVLGCTAPNTSVSETPPPQVIRPENTHVLRDTSTPRKDTGHLQVTPLPAPYKSWEAFYDDFFSEDESVSFRTQGLVQVANYNLPSLTANMKYGGTPWKIEGIPHRFNLPQVLKETDKTNAFFQVAELGRDDNNKLFVSKVILAISLYKRQDVSEHYEVKNWMNRHFYSEDGITFEAREPTDGEKNYTLLKASYKDLTPYEKNRDYGDSTASYADLTTCNSYYRVESGTRAVNYPVNILSLSGPGAPDENGKMYATATGQVKSVFYGTASHRARFYCPVESTSDNDNSLGEISSDAYFTFNALWDPNQQISCYKTEGSTITGDKWYYDSLSEVPKIFSVNNQQCSPCQPGALRDDSMPEICRSTSPSPTPTPTASPSPSPSSTPTPSPSPSPDPTPTPSPDPTPTPSDEGQQCPNEMNATIKEKSDESVARIANAISDIPQSVIDELNLFENSQKDFQTKAIGSDLRQSIVQLKKSMNNLKGARTVQESIRHSQIVQRNSLDVTSYISSINMSKLALKAGSQTVSYAVGIGEIALIAYELSKIYEDIAYVCQDVVSTNHFNSALSALNLWITSVEPVFDKLLDSAECIKNANAQKTASRMQGLRAQLRNITKHISSGLDALRQENFSAANTAFSKAEQYAQQTANSHKNILKAVEQDCEIEDNPCHEDEEFLGVVGNNWTVCANLDHAVKNAGKKNRLQHFLKKWDNDEKSRYCLWPRHYQKI